MSEEIIYHLRTQLFEDESIEKELVDTILKDEFKENIDFIENVKLLQRNKNAQGNLYPLLDQNYYYFIIENAKKILQIVDSVQAESEHYQFTYFGLETLRSKYLLSTHDGYKESIENFWIRISLFLWQNNLDKFKEMYKNLRQGIYIPATPTLFNSGCMNSQLASCFLLGTIDSIDGIFDSVKDVAKISKMSGGVGLHVHQIRSNGSYVHGTNGKSNGLVPMLKVFNDVARYVDQGGKRNGSFAIYLEPWHSDIFDFLNLKKNIGSDEIRARDLFYGLWIPDLFMKKIYEDDFWYLMNPSESKDLSKVYGEEFENLYHEYILQGKFTKKIKARSLWVEIMRVQIETGSPYILYKDACNRLSNQKNLGVIQSSNLCTEIIQYSDNEEISVCNLSSISLPKFLTKNVKSQLLENVEIITAQNCPYCALAKYFLKENGIVYTELDKDSCYGILKYQQNHSYPQIFSNDSFLGGFQNLWNDYLQPTFNFERFSKIVMDVVENLNQVIDRNNYPLEKCKKSNLRNRPMGIGVQGLADCFNRMLISYDSEKAKELNREIFETLYYFALTKSHQLAKFHGKPYDSFVGSPLSKGLFHFELYDEERKYPYKLKYDWNLLRQNILRDGVYNSLLIAMMPTASTSQLLGNTESFEPLTSNLYLRRTLSGEFYVINRFLQNLLKEMNFWNQDFKDKMLFYKGSIQPFEELPTFFRNIFKTVWEISQKSLIDLSSDRGYFIDQSQSFNIYLTNSSIELLNKIHFYGWKKGLKTGSYYIRTRALTSGQNFSLSSEKEKELECENCSA
tara:strand:+ start:33 stop:2414 length:2382 start_codon:yes stop_codon:yes gene_type:complete